MRVSGLTDLDLDPADAVGQRFRGAFLDLLDRRVQETAGRVVRADRVPVGAEQLGQREIGPLRLQVPERDVDRRDRLRRDSGSADRRAGPEQLVVHLADVRRVLADQPRRDFLRMRVLRRTAGPLGVAEPDPALLLLGRDLREQEHDLGHRPLPPGQHLRVADRLIERKNHGRELHLADAIHGQ
jgi:hypothetical protein